MGTSWDEAVAALTAPGAAYELIEQEIRGQKLRVFKNAPPSLRALYEASRKRGAQTFLVYEDERLSFA
jgi:long-chain acyl-CoA synthetase